MIALSRPVNILSGAIARVAVSGRYAGTDFDKIKRFCMKLGIAMALIVGTVPIIFSSLISIFLKTGSLFLFLPIGLTLFFWSLTSILRGLYTSIESFGVLSYASAVELFIRALCGIILVILGLQVFGALIGSAFGALSVLVLLFSRRKNIVKIYNERKQQGSSEESFGSISTKVFFIALPTGFFLELDLLLAKRYFAPEEAGIYAAAALIGKGLLMLSTVASTVVYPKLVEEKLNKKGIIAFLWGVGITILLFVCGYFFLVILGKHVIELLFGDKYLGTVDLVSSYVLALVPLAIHLQVTNYKGAIGGWIEGAWLWLLLGGYYVSLEIFSSSVHSYLWAIFFFHAIMTPLSALILYFRHKEKANENLDSKQA